MECTSALGPRKSRSVRCSTYAASAINILVERKSLCVTAMRHNMGVHSIECVCSTWCEVQSTVVRRTLKVISWGSWGVECLYILQCSEVGHLHVRVRVYSSGRAEVLVVVHGKETHVNDVCIRGRGTVRVYAYM